MRVNPLGDEESKPYRTRPHDAQDSDDEQHGEGHIAADEGGSEDRGQDGEGGHGGMGQWGEEAGEGASESREHEGVEAERPDAGAGLRVVHASPPAARLSHRRCCLFMSCAMAPSFTVGNPCPVALPSSRMITSVGILPLTSERRREILRPISGST